MDNNLEASVALTSALLKYDKLRSGALVVYCSSIQATHTRAQRALYAAAKAGTEGFMRGIAAELAGAARTVCLRMGQLQGQMQHIKLDTAEIARLQQRCYTPWSSTADIARLIWQLYEQPALTGACLELDSGQSRNVW